MRIIPVLLDAQPAYLAGGPAAASLLLAPLGEGTVLDHVCSRLADVAGARPIVAACFAPTAEYEAAIRAACPQIEEVVSAAELDPLKRGDEPSDWLLLVDPRCFPVDGLDMMALCRPGVGDPRGARHLVALEMGTAGTREYVESDAEGRVRRIQRYYDGVTWPFAAGIACSLVPVASLSPAEDLPVTSLTRLRSALVARGVPSRDLAVNGGVFDLASERGLLALNDRYVLQRAADDDVRPRRPRPPRSGQDSRVHPSARLLGAVIVQPGAVVEEGATVVGPAVIGASARVARNAMVAQCVIAPGCVVPEGATVRQRAVFTSPGAAVSAPAGTPIGGEALGAEPSGTPFELSVERRSATWYPAVKRLVEGTVALAALVLLAPLLAVLAVLVKLTSPGPVLFRDEREGKGGRPFRCWKFRTMVANAHAAQRALYEKNEVDGPQFKLDHDPRLTPIGRWLRVTCLDELPQLVNVLLGEMSLVGPRPSPFRENQMCVPWRDARLSVRPGITGLWQVCRHERAHGDFHQWIQFDLLYVRHLSPWLDLKIVIATILTLGAKSHVPPSWMLPASASHAVPAGPRVQATPAERPPRPAA